MYNIKTRYQYGFWELLWTSPRFGVMFLTMFLSVAFAGADMAVSIRPLNGAARGINPCWVELAIYRLRSATCETFR